MKLEAVTAEIRPRSDWEAVDLGFAMVRRDFWRCILVWWLAMLPPLLLATVFLWRWPLLLAMLFWWWKPFGSRIVLFELSRRLFGEKPGWRAVLREIPRTWFRRFFSRMIMGRFSPWLPVTIAVEDLEGLKGNGYRQRASQIAKRGNGVMMWIYFTADLAAMWLALSIFAIIFMMLPEGHEGPWKTAMESFDNSNPADIPLVITWTASGCAMFGMALVDLFVTGAGFGVYVNNRTWLEGWDVELAFKRIGQRLAKIAVVIALAVCCLIPRVSAAEGPPKNAEIIREVKESPDFKVHTETIKVPVQKPKESSSSRSSSKPSDSAFALSQILGYSLLAAMICVVGWLIWMNRHAFRLRKGEGAKVERRTPSARTVMGMEITVESLPADIPTAAWSMWMAGRRHEALALLYRGAIAQTIEVGRVDIQESDTEGDCLRRVEAAGSPAHPEYFRGLTGIWIRLAYAAEIPGEPDVRALCNEWPFGGRRGA